MEGDLISQSEIQAELDSLRSLRRRSLSSPQAIDPDLPPPSPSSTSPPPSPTDPASSAQATPPSTDSDQPLTGALSQLFWLPASLHPELAPQKFREFIKEQASPENLLRRNGHLARRKSTLSRQYTPSLHDGVPMGQDDKPPSPTALPKASQLTISDLERLEELTNELGEGPSQESDARLKSLLQRSMSLGSLAETSEGDSPLIVPAPGSILRRSARTKIRKTSLLGDGNGHRFGPSRRGRVSSTSIDLSASLNQGDTSADIESEDSHDLPSKETKALAEEDALDSNTCSPSPTQRASAPSLSIDTTNLTDSIDPGSAHQRSISGDSFLDAYISSSPDRDRRSWPSPVFSLSEEPQSTLDVAQIPAIPASPPMPSTSSTPAQVVSPPSTPAPARQPLLHPQALPKFSPPPPQPLVHVPIPVKPEKTDKEKKSPWSRLVGRSTPKDDDAEDNASLASTIAKKGKKKGKPAIEPAEDVPSRKSKDVKETGGFFGTLFAKKRADVEEQSQPSPQPQEISPTASGMMGADGRYTNFYRLPIHIERAVYRLSHVKLANPRRPLYEQVLISNLMFWYLGVVQARPAPNSPPTSDPPVTRDGVGTSHPDVPSIQPENRSSSLELDRTSSQDSSSRPLHGRSLSSGSVPTSAPLPDQAPTAAIPEDRSNPPPPVPIRQRVPDRDFEVLRPSPQSPSNRPRIVSSEYSRRPGMPRREPSNHSTGAPIMAAGAANKPDVSPPISPQKHQRGVLDPTLT